jgi:diguanylate cyclase (GGDEF)-like protein
MLYVITSSGAIIFNFGHGKKMLKQIIETASGPLSLGATSETHESSKPHRTRLLAWILFVLIFFMAGIFFVVLFFTPNEPVRAQYLALIIFLLLFFGIAYALNCTKRYTIAVSMLVFSAFIAPWASLFFDPAVLQGDFVPLTYVTLSILISSIFLPTLVTSILAIIQFSGVALVLLLCSAYSSFNWISFLVYIFVASAFSMLTNNIIQRNIKQLRKQAQLLQENAEHLERLSTRDDLTKLFNRRYLTETLKRELRRMSRKNTHLGLIMLDIDRFKQINDTMGHAAGDIVLQELGKLLSEQIRESDIACRYGGDEFILILPDTSPETTLERAEKLQNDVKTLNTPMNITLSLGIATYPQNGKDTEILIKSADHALYRAKDKGGNTIALATE